MKTRNTIQRQLVLNSVVQLGDHPTAEEVYERVRSIYPDISLATVYRNLNLLAETGRLLKISVPGAADRFDHNNLPHYHLKCSRCGRLFDLPLAYRPSLDEEARQNSGCSVTGHEIIFHGFCPDCKGGEES